MNVEEWLTEAAQLEAQAKATPTTNDPLNREDPR